MSILSLVVAIVGVFFILAVTVESSQRFLYDQVVEWLWLRALIAAIPLGVLIVLFPFDLERFFLTNPIWLFLQAGIWFLVVWIVFQFQAGHAAALAPVLYGSAAWAISFAARSVAAA